MLTIIPFEERYQPDFKRLNLEWLDRYHLTESHDLEILDDPQRTILDRGGVIFLAIDDSRVIGTAGIWKENEKEYELIKMAVDPVSRGKGISKLLLDECLRWALLAGASRVYLYSNSQLKTALSLYEKYGFRYIEVTGAPFVTADIKMELSLVPNTN